MKTVMVHPNGNKPGVANYLRRCVDRLLAQGAQVWLEEDSCQLAALPDAVRRGQREQCLEMADFVLALGGDGTILSIAKDAAEKGVPLLGINLGHVGFLTDLERDELSLVDEAVAGRYTEDRRMMLDVAIWRGGRVIYQDSALNDVTVANGNMQRTVEVEAAADDIPAFLFRGDGVIVSTPTGSTAYSLAAGGPIVEPTADNIVVTPICAHTLQTKPCVFSAERVVSVRAASLNGDPVYASVDGKGSVECRSDDRIVMRRSQYETTLLRVKNQSFYHLLKQKLSEGSVR